MKGHNNFVVHKFWMSVFSNVQNMHEYSTIYEYTPSNFSSCTRLKIHDDQGIHSIIRGNIKQHEMKNGESKFQS